ncbi:MAG: S-layer homology domain-containing protein, partial [Syntrophomonadales bacterium]
MKNKSLVWVTLFAFFLSVGMGVMAPPQPALAGGGAGGGGAAVPTITEVANQIAQVYGCLDEVDKQVIRDARDRANALDPTNPNDWDTIVNPLLTQQVIDRFGGDAQAITDARNELIQFAKDMSLIYYPADGDWEAYLTTISNNAEARAGFQTLMGYGDPTKQITFTDLVNLAKRAKELTPGVIKTNAGYLNAVTSGTDAALAGQIYNIAEDALREALNENPDLKAKLQLLGWNAAILRDLQQRVSTAVDPDHKADIALLYGYIRTTTTLHYNDAGDPVPTTVTGDPNTYVLTPGKSVKVKVMGREILNVGISLRDNNYNEVPWAGTDGQGYPKVPAKPGNYTVVGYRNASADFVERAWILKQNVVIPNTLSNNTDLAQIKLNGQPLVGFSANTLNYVVTLEAGALVPDVTAVTASTTASIQSNNYAAPTQTIVVRAQDGTTKTYTVKFVWRTAVPVAIGGNTPVDMAANENVELNTGGATAGQLATTTVTVTVPQNATNPTITVTPTANTTTGKKEATLPQIIATTQQAGAPNIEVTISGGTVVTGPDNWDGTLALPKVLNSASATVPGTVNKVIEFGMGDADITFSNAIRLLVPGAKDHKVGYVKQGQFWEITFALAGDSPAGLGNPVSTLPHGGDGYFVVGADKAIWTKHATEFVAYTPTPSGGGGGGGGGGATPTGTSVTAAQGGTVTSGSASVVIPANALAADARIKIEKLTSTAGLTFAANQKLVSEVYDITKDKSGDFKKPVSITLGFDPSQVDTSKYDLIICWYDSTNKKWVKLDNIKIDLTGKKVTGDTSHFTKFAVIAQEKTVTPPEPTTDLTDIKGHWAVNEIVSLVDLKVLSGYPDKTFKPNNDISRAEFATVLVKALKLEART